MTRTIQSPAIFSVTQPEPHYPRRWMNIDAPFSDDVKREFCGLTAADAAAGARPDSYVSMKLCSEPGKPGLFVTVDDTGFLKHCSLPLSETPDQWRRRVADVASRAVVYGRG